MLLAMIDDLIRSESQRMEVTTRNINFVKFLNSSSTSVYTPNKENDKHTDYQITIRTSAFREFSPPHHAVALGRFIPYCFSKRAGECEMETELMPNCREKPLG